MTDHLPECPCIAVGVPSCICDNDEECGPQCRHRCICDRLRAAEQRVTEQHNAEHEDDRFAAFQNGFAAAVQAARDAVAALPHALNCWDRYGDHIAKADALAVIDGEKP